MSDLREAAQQALDALEYYRSGEDYPSPAVEAITALRAALEQPEPRNQCGETCERAKLCAICARGLEQPEQEPMQIKPPNQEGKTLCAVRWMAETPAGWVGAWDREALQQFVTHPQRRRIRSQMTCTRARTGRLDRMPSELSGCTKCTRQRSRSLKSIWIRRRSLRLVLPAKHWLAR